MTALHKIVFTGTLTAAVATSVYQFSQASHLRREVQALHRQQAPLTGRIQDLQRERDSATNRLFALTDRVASANADHSELLKLRGEVTRLRGDTRQIMKALFGATPFIKGKTFLTRRLS